LAKIQRVTGTLDVLPDDQRYWDWIIKTVTDIAVSYGFSRIDVPILEYTELFARGMGTASDVFVQKEMYTLEEPDGTSITLRPEYTAGVVRSYIQNGMSSWTQPVKVFMIGPIFRRERPQAGRYRQHSQINVEILGETDPAADLEVMMVAMNLYKALGYQGLMFQLNSAGCQECRPAYIDEFIKFLKVHEDKLADIDKVRLQKNALRVLDSKEPGMEELLADAPHIIDYLCADCESHFSELRTLLDALETPYSINNRIVRGIDYYTKTVFEVWAKGIGAQASVCGGGRYDGLSEALGGPSAPSVGFGSGVERIVLALRQQGVEPPEVAEPEILIAHFGGETKIVATKLAYEIRDAGIGARLAFARKRRSMKSQMREGNRHNVKYMLIVGESELEAREVTVRPMTGGDQIQVASDKIVDWIIQQ